MPCPGGWGKAELEGGGRNPSAPEPEEAGPPIFSRSGLPKCKGLWKGSLGTTAEERLWAGEGRGPWEQDVSEFLSSISIVPLSSCVSLGRVILSHS